MTEQAPLQADDLYQLEFVSDPQISPDGQRVAYVLTRIDREKNEYLSNVYVDCDGRTQQFTSGGKDASPRWSPDGGQMAFLSRRGDKAQIYLIPSDGGESVPLTELELGAGEPVWSPDSRRIAFSAAVALVPAPKDDKKDDKPAPTRVMDRASFKFDGRGYIGDRRNHLFVMDVASKEVKQIGEGDVVEGKPCWSPDGEQLAFASNRSPNWDVSLESFIYVMSTAGGEPRPVTREGAFEAPCFSPDGSRVAMVGYRDPDDVFAPPRLFSVALDGSDLRDEQGDWDGELGNAVISDMSAAEHGVALFWRADGIYFLGTERGSANVYRAVGGTVTAVSEGKHTITDFSLSEDGTMAFGCGDATHPTEIFLRRDGKTEQLTHLNAFLAERRIATPEHVTFTGVDGQPSEGWLLRPPGEGSHPLIVYIHGGPAAAHGEAFFFEYQLLAGAGFGVFFPNIHGSASYGRDYQTSINGRFGTVDYEDVLAGTEAARSRDWVDEDRIGIAGGSYGGYMSSWTLGHSDIFKAGLVERCLSNIVSFYGTSDTGWAWN
ncbi:MAG: S9 family peptidase, partial [Chloroflexota bacterium]